MGCGWRREMLPGSIAALLCLTVTLQLPLAASAAEVNTNNTIHCKDTSNCNREVCNDGRDYAPFHCLKHLVEMDCYRHCTEPRELDDCFSERRKNKTEEYCVLKYERRILIGPGKDNVTVHPGLSCDYKCQTDPKFWSCVHECDRGGCFETFRKCERKEKGKEPPCNPGGLIERYWSTPDCKKCYVKGLREEVEKSPDCVIRYSSGDTGLEDDSDSMLERSSQRNRCIYKEKPDLPEESIQDDQTQVKSDIDKCVEIAMSMKENLGVKFIEECYRKRLMKQQFDWCMKKEFTPQCNVTGSKACHDRCMRLLAKPYCHIPCKRNEALQKCADSCKVKWPAPTCLCGKGDSEFKKFLLDESGTKRISKFFEKTRNCADNQCFMKEILVDSPTPTDGSPMWRAAPVKIRNCMSERHVIDFAKMFVSEYNRTQFEKSFLYTDQQKSNNGTKNVTATFAEDIGHIADHYTYMECEVYDCSDAPKNDILHCVEKCVKKLREPEEMKLVCDESGESEDKDKTDPTATEGGGSLKTISKDKNVANFLRAEIVLLCMLKVNRNRDWTFEKYLSLMTHDFKQYEKLVDCERNMRSSNGTTDTVSQNEYGIFANISYELGKKWCQECEISAADSNIFHSELMDQARCVLDECYRPKLGLGNSCPPLKSTTTIVKAGVVSQCGWQLDYSLTRDPLRIWKTYFDETPPYDVSSSLLQPNTEKYLLKSSVSGHKGHYAFPYFIVLRGVCENGNYDDNVYKFIASGATPVVKLIYLPNTSRLKYTLVVTAIFEAALANLERKSVEEKAYIRPNPRNRRINETSTELDGKYGCHLNMCYPAFLVPQALLHIPIFKIIVEERQGFSQLNTHAYAYSMHGRDTSGEGRLVATDRKVPPTSDECFPNRRVQIYEDTQYADMWNRLPDSGYNDTAESGKPSLSPAGPELEHVTDENCKKYEAQESLALGGNEHLPLDTEDFFRLQYVHGNAPQVVLAGFYDPNIVIIGDPDMRSFLLAKWQFETSSGTKENPTARVFHGGYSCLTQQYRVAGFYKPMYSLYDRSDPDYWLQHYRMRYLPKNYSNASEAKAIFDAITLEDRIVLVTTGGLVSVYQNFNTTSGLGKQWEVEENDTVKRCFKIVRCARRSHQQGDLLVAITYDYQVHDLHDNVLKDINQQVWVARYTEPGKKLNWREITSRITTSTLRHERWVNVGGEELGTSQVIPEQKIMEIPVERREISPKSQIEAICYKAYRSNMGKASHIELVEDHGWCDAVDATPVTALNSVIQILVRMRVYYSGGTGSSTEKGKRNVVFYVVASLNIHESLSRNSNWQIDSIIPRIPCLDEHEESIPSVVPFTMEYFRTGDPGSVGTDHGCHRKTENLEQSNLIFLHGMTYTRSYNRHLFLYGNKLLQSTDGGQTFVLLKSFPQQEKGKYQCKESSANYHRIKIMAFDDLGHYAFLTSKRELWYGNLGSLQQIRLRPSDTHSMVGIRLPEARELVEAVPFTVFIDASNHLTELVAMVNKDLSVTRIARRPINDRTILRARFLIKKFKETETELRQNLKDDFRTKAVIDSKQTEDLRFKHVDWSVFCPFASPHFSHNFTTQARSQIFFFPSPKQHSKLGMAHTITSLHSYQAATFGLVWSSLFNQPYRAYSGLDIDPYVRWVALKNDRAVIGRMTYLNDDPKEHGILVLPDKYQRWKTPLSDRNRIYQTYYLDYNIIVYLTVEFSVSNDFTFNPVNYEDHLLSAIHLNVDNSNGSLIQINTDREVIASKAAVRYTVHMSLKKDFNLEQRLPGRQGIKVPIYFHLIDGFGICVPTDAAGIKGDTIATSVTVGCPPSIDLTFDWKATLNSIRFRDMNAHYGQTPDECYEGEQFCFFMKYPLVLHFDIFDNAKQTSKPFTGKYVMRIVAGGYSKEKLRDYSLEEQQAFNIPGVSDVSLIWNEWDLEHHRKVDRKDKFEGKNRNDTREIVLTAGMSSIQWACHTLSPCARIAPTSSLESIYYFKVFISNRGVDNETLCLFEKEFIILLYGFPPSTEIQLITTVVFYVVMLVFVYIAYLCARGNKKVWRSLKGKVHDWFQIILDTLPTAWTKTEEEEEEESEAEKQKRRDEIILSLQGHLNVPRLIHEPTMRQTTADTASDVKPVKKRGSIESEISKESSETSIKSMSSIGSRPNVLNPLAERPEAATWTDLIYERIISRRLAEVIERNRERQRLAKRFTGGNEQKK